MDNGGSPVNRSITEISRLGTPHPGWIFPCFAIGDSIKIILIRPPFKTEIHFGYRFAA